MVIHILMTSRLKGLLAPRILVFVVTS